MEPLHFFKDGAELLRRLIASGLSEQAAGDKLLLFAQSSGALKRSGIKESVDTYGFFVPGRVEVLGKHTDYAGGRSVVGAVERGFCLIAAGRTDNQVNITAAGTGERIQFEIVTELQPTMGHWSNYPMTAVRRAARNFGGELHGVDVAFASDLPAAAGMSSSSALIVSMFKVLAKINRLDQRPEYRQNIDSNESLAGFLGTVENGGSFGALAGDKGVGTFGGSEDHTAILCAHSGRLSQYSYCPVRWEKTIEMPAGYVFLIAASGVAAEKTGSALEKYNRASRLASAVTAAWNRATGHNDTHLAAAVARGPEAVKQMRDILKTVSVEGFDSEELTKRFEHFYAESEEIIPAAGTALEQGDISAFGREVDRSQELTETLLGNQIPETIFLARAARKIGAAAASAFGAGFGGSVWALTREDEAEAMLKEWAKRYQEAFPERISKASFFISRAGPAAFEVN